MGKTVHIILTIITMLLVANMIVNIKHLSGEAIAFLGVLLGIYFLYTPYSIFNKSFYKHEKNIK
jgi:hypothetical protein